MCTSASDSQAGGIRLIRLINERMPEILRRERKNEQHICLYGTGEYWIAFEHSAYFLSRLFPEAETFVLRHPDYPFTVVAASVTDDNIKRYMKKHISYFQDTDYIELLAISHNPIEYGEWHTLNVRKFMESTNKNVS